MFILIFFLGDRTHYMNKSASGRGNERVLPKFLSNVIYVKLRSQRYMKTRDNIITRNHLQTCLTSKEEVYESQHVRTAAKTIAYNNRRQIRI